MPAGIDRRIGDIAVDQKRAYHHALGAGGREALPPQDERRKQEAHRGEARKLYACPGPPSASASPPSATGAITSTALCRPQSARPRPTRVSLA